MTFCIINFLEVVSIAHNESKRQIVHSVVDIGLNRFFQFIIGSLILYTCQLVASGKFFFCIQSFEMLLFFFDFIINIFNSNNIVSFISGLLNSHSDIMSFLKGDNPVILVAAFLIHKSARQMFFIYKVEYCIAVAFMNNICNINSGIRKEIIP